MARIWEGISEEVIFDILIIVGASCWIYDCLIDIEGFDEFLVKRSDERELFFKINRYKRYQLFKPMPTGINMIEFGLEWGWIETRVHRHGWSIRVRDAFCGSRFEVIGRVMDHQHPVWYMRM
jgi:hypothetical protein